MRSRALQPPYVEAAFDVQHLASRVIKKSVQKMEQKGRSEFFGSSAQAKAEARGLGTYMSRRPWKRVRKHLFRRTATLQASQTQIAWRGSLASCEAEGE
jgi:hypothetical protein